MKIIIENIDIDLLKRQKADLVEILNILENIDMLRENKKSLDGILNLLDHITDSDIERRIIP